MKLASEGGLFYWLMRIWGGKFWPFKPFLKLKTTICKSWTFIKIKIGMACVCKEYGGKMKIVTAKNEVLVGL